jgi:hypothetical protein
MKRRVGEDNFVLCVLGKDFNDSNPIHALLARET